MIESSDSGTSAFSWKAAASHFDTDVRDVGRRWLSSAPLAAVMIAFGASPELTRSPAAFAAWAAKTLDTRRGRERQQAHPIRFNDRQVEALGDAATLLGLMSTAGPTRDQYDATVILGGTAVANRLRTRLAATIAGAVRQGHLIALASDRRLLPSELSRPGVTAEWEDLSAEVSNAFGPLEQNREARFDSPEPHQSWVDLELRGSTGLVRVMCAPSSRSGHRANTTDAVAFLTDRLSRQTSTRLLLITSAIYTPYTFFVAAPLILTNFAETFEVIGTATGVGDRALLAQRIAQELNATIQTLVRILE